MPKFCANCGIQFGDGNFCSNCGNPKDSEIVQGVPSHFQKFDMTQSGIDEQRAKLIGAQAKNAELGGKLAKGALGIVAVYLGIGAIFLLICFIIFLANI